MLEYASIVHDRALGDVRRDKNRRYANAKAIEVKRLARLRVLRLRDEPVRDAAGRRDVIVDAAMLVVRDQERRARPERRVLTNRHVDGRDETLALADVMIGMLIRRDHRSVGSIVIAVVGFDERVFGERAAATVVEELIVSGKQLR